MNRLYLKRKQIGSFGIIVRRYTALLLALSLLLTSVVSYAESGSQNVTVQKFEMEIIEGYTRNEDGVYVWEASSAEAGHMFIFNILFQTSGNGKIEPGAVKITVPKSILDGMDIYSMPVPHRDEITTDELKALNDWVYYEDEDGNIVITNINEIDAGGAYNFNVGYSTSEKTYYYEDMGEYDDIKASLDLDISEGSKEHLETDPLAVAIDTSVTIQRTNKYNPTSIIEEWNPTWGEAPDDAGDYYYLIWEVETLIDRNSTQFYDFSLFDNNFICTSPEGFDSSELKVLGYNFWRSGNSYDPLPENIAGSSLPEPKTVKGQEEFETRHDFVLTAIPREWYDNLKEDEAIELENNVDATVIPIDGKDDPTTAKAKQTYTLKQPKFAPPIGSFYFVKTGGLRTYQLDLFTDKNYNENEEKPIAPFDYTVNASGYSYDQTYYYDGTVPDDANPQTYVPENDYRNYGKKKLNYTITDNTVSLEGYVGSLPKDDPYINNPLEKGDYYFTSVAFAYDIDMVAKDANGNPSLNDKSQSYIFTKPVSGSGYEVFFDVFGEFNGVYKKIATVQAYASGASAVKYVPEYDPKNGAAVANINANVNGFKIDFVGEDCTGYKIVTSDDLYYHVDFTAKPSLKLNKNNTELQTWINDKYGTSNAKHNEERVTELRVTNKADLEVKGENDNKIFYKEDSATDYQNESKKESTIIKNVTAVNNNTLYKRYEISWRINISEYVVVSSTGENNIPVTQYGGEFFDLLPIGSSIDMSTVKAFREDNIPVEFIARIMPGADNRVLLRVTIDDDQPGEKYSLMFTTYHAWEDIAAFGTNILNPAAYITGNNDMANTTDGGIYQRGKYTGDSMDIMVRSINSAGGYEEILSEIDGDMVSYYGDTYDRAIFSYEPYDIKAVIMSNVGVRKTVKNATEGSYSTKTIVDQEDGDYSYRLRYENSITSKSLDNVFVDFLESFNGDYATEGWHGTVKSIDVTNLLDKGTIPMIYYSTEEFSLYETQAFYVTDKDIYDDDGELIIEKGNKIELVEGSSKPKYYEVENADGSKEKHYTVGIRKFLPDDEIDTYIKGNEYWSYVDPALCTNGIYDMSGIVSELEEKGLRITAIAIDYTYADRSKFGSNDEEVIDPDHPTIDSDDLNKNAKITKDGKYIMGLGEAAYVIVNMDSSKAERPMTKEEYKAKYGEDADYEAYINAHNAYNDIYIASNVFGRGFTSNKANDPAAETWAEQNYTTVSYRIRSDFYAKKVNAKNPEETVGGITFNLTGVSYYGTRVNQSITTTSNGMLIFDDLEMGTYTLVEIDCGKDWQIDRTEYTVTVDSNGKVIVEPELDINKDGGPYSDIDTPFILTNEPRAHADISFDKVLFKNGLVKWNPLKGAVFKLSGTSDYGNEIVKTAISDDDGIVLFEDVEQGTYEMIEVEAPEGHVLSNIVYEVRVDENSNWSITVNKNATPEGAASLLEGDSINGYTIGNEKYQEFYLLKLSSQPIGPDNVSRLEGAVFRLSGQTKDGKQVDMEVTSGYTTAYNDGVAYFSKLAPGTYYLWEQTPPTLIYTDSNGKEVEQKFLPNDTIYTVIVTDDGVTIEGLESMDDDLFKFENVPIGGQVIVRKVWIDDLTPEERIKMVKSPDIVISRDKPDPFTNEYAEFDYKGFDNRNNRLGNLGKSVDENKGVIKKFERYPRKLSLSDQTVEKDGKTYRKLFVTVNGVEKEADIVSTPGSVRPIYGWLDDATGTYYWYTEATGAKLPTAYELFKNITTMESADFSGIDLSQTASFESMFNGCTNLVDVTNLRRDEEDSRQGVSAKNMFYGCAKLASGKTLDLTDFYTNGITNMSNMFGQAIKNGSGTTIDWGDALNTGDATTVAKMFNACTALQRLIAIEIDLNNVSATGAEDGLYYMFGESGKLESIPRLVRSSDAPQGISAAYMFFQCAALYTSGNTPRVIDFTGFDTTGITSMAHMFQSAFMNGENTVINWGSALNTGSVTSVDNMFNTSNRLKAVYADEFDLSAVTSNNGFINLFADSSALVAIPKLVRSEAAAKLSAKQMFRNCNMLSRAGKTVGVMDFREFNTKGITSMEQMFQNSFRNGDETVINWGEALNTEDVTTFVHMFDTCHKLKQLNATEINANGVTESDSFAYMFCNAQALEVVPAFVRTENIAKKQISMYQMFYQCFALQAIDMSKFNTKGVTNMAYVFYRGDNLTNLDMSGLDTSDVTNMSYMFRVPAITSLDLSNFDTSNVTNMSFMFHCCSLLTDIDFSSFNTRNVTNMANMFDNCSQLTTLDLSSFRMDSLTNAVSMFTICNNLRTIYADESFDFSKSTTLSGQKVFNNVNSLVGGQGTRYNTDPVRDNRDLGTNARIDGGEYHLGYFTSSSARPQTGEKLRMGKETQTDEKMQTGEETLGSLVSAIFNGTVTSVVSELTEKTVTTAASVTDAVAESLDAAKSGDENSNTDTKADDENYRNSANHHNMSGPCEICGKDHFTLIKEGNVWTYIFDDVVGEDFYVWEENIPKGYTGDFDNYEDENGHRVTQIKDGVATITNRKVEVGTLTISKAVFDVNNDDADVSDQVNTKYTFEITLSNLSTTSNQTVSAVYYKTTDGEAAAAKTEMSVLFVAGKATIEIQSGYSLKFYDLPEGTTYTVKELPSEDVESITIVGGEPVEGEDNAVTGTIKGNTDLSVEYENHISADIRPDGEFRLKKKVENENGVIDPDAEYSFTIEFENLMKNTEYSIYNGEEVVKTFTSDSNKKATVVVNLKHNDELVFKGIPEGATYRITEASGSAYISSYVVTTGDANANTAPGNELSTQWQTVNPPAVVTTTFTNRIVKTQSLSLTKRVVGDGPDMPDPETKYPFVAQFSNLGAYYQLVAAGVGTFVADEYGNLEIRFLLTAGESVDFNNIPVGATYAIYEDFNGELIPYYDVEYIDETTGEKQEKSSAPSASTGADISEAAQAAQAAVDAAQSEYDVAASLLSSDKKALDSAIAAVIALLTEEQRTDNAESMLAFTADNYIDKKAEYEAARDVILALITDSSYENSIKEAEEKVTSAAAAYTTASERLAAAKAALKEARGSSYVDGSVELNKDTAIRFSNIKACDLAITKKVTGDFENEAEEFHFKAKFEYNDTPLEGSYSATLTGAAKITDSSYQTDDLSHLFGADGIIYFVLRDGDTITFENLPYGTTYTIEEDGAEGYRVSFAAKTNDTTVETKGRIANGTVEGDISVMCRNYRPPHLPSSGGSGAKLIYQLGIAIMMAGLACAVLYRKRCGGRV